MSEPVQRLRDLRRVLTRLAVRPTVRYWRSDWRVFASNFIGGAFVGAAASVFAAVLVGIDAHRGADSFAYHALTDVQTVVRTIEADIERELH